ncbi:MAG TPA: Gfo/Idh/MocA family oxidoreductase [Polyangia bacterium]|jgi:predicted dehydrogenase|nr:Gfo/Idh/MocA family oxidoreductase [Polyangia bacterium]
MKKTLRGAIIGYGFIMEKGHAAGYRQRATAGDGGDVEIVAVADVSPARRALALQQLPGVRVYPDHASLLAAERDLDFADIATPPSDHATVAHAAMDAGLHVLCEKPLATTVDEARSMLKHATTAGRVIFPCHNYKHAPVIKAVRRILDSGRIGKVHLVTLQTFRNTHAKGIGDWRPDWRRERRYSGGGIAMDHGSHTFYLAFEWLRGYPTAISARMATMGSFDTEDDFTCSLKFPTGFASAHLSWTAGVRKVLYTLHGEHGAVRVEDDNIELATQVPAEGRGPATKWTFEREEIPSDWMDSSHVTWFNSLFDDFKGAIARRDFVGQEARESFLCVQLITTAYASARDGSRELPLGGPRSLEGHDIGDMVERRQVGSPSA